MLRLLGLLIVAFYFYRFCRAVWLGYHRRALDGSEHPR
ncbi:hypothetical protein ACPOL_3560 [Acidisarcina polymorpha]|uniref:Uncharacterized protein n=1 Tax=Acidisarcina polymorpha TaxID=2211140 RepID=A0A2Z5G2F4_9BACT|nr:hypothetical protein ACPOL_3560 [Acidisarcina polymorpha]